ncbi:MAG: hypothetical protein ACJAZW_000455 [Maritalea sp.]|jgi:hypothetical protein
MSGFAAEGTAKLQPVLASSAKPLPQPAPFPTKHSPDVRQQFAPFGIPVGIGSESCAVNTALCCIGLAALMPPANELLASPKASNKNNIRTNQETFMHIPSPQYYHHARKKYNRLGGQIVMPSTPARTKPSTFCLSSDWRGTFSWLRRNTLRLQFQPTEHYTNS